MVTGNRTLCILAYELPPASSEINAGDNAYSMPTATSGFEGLESKNNPSKEGFSNTGSVQKVGKKKAAGPLKFVAFKNNVQD